MMDDLAARFLPQFIAIARTRVAAALQAAVARDPAAAAATSIRELHALAGEAGLLGLRDVVPLARAGEAIAKDLRAGGEAGAPDPGQLESLIESLRRIERAIEGLAQPATAAT